MLQQLVRLVLTMILRLQVLPSLPFKYEGGAIALVIQQLELFIPIQTNSLQMLFISDYIKKQMVLPPTFGQILGEGKMLTLWSFFRINSRKFFYWVIRLSK
ncbi:MAG: hypothetical protein IPO48_02210 [Saprospiraceae bacterium]|nr:hypothetical protein [Saprospiraceae bacterium]